MKLRELWRISVRIIRNRRGEADIDALAKEVKQFSDRLPVRIGGTTFDRPQFKAMMTEVEKGNVTAVITKDLSRLGRDYLKTGEYVEIIFPRYDVRYIAVNDDVDTDKELNEFMPFRNLFNEFHCRETSKKIRLVNRAKAERGERLATRAPFGYLKDPGNPKKLIVDETAAPIVRKIFDWCAGGLGPS